MINDPEIIMVNFSPWVILEMTKYWLQMVNQIKQNTIFQAYGKKLSISISSSA